MQRARDNSDEVGQEGQVSLAGIGWSVGVYQQPVSAAVVSAFLPRE